MPFNANQIKTAYTYTLAVDYDCHSPKIVVIEDGKIYLKSEFNIWWKVDKFGALRAYWREGC